MFNIKFIFGVIFTFMFDVNTFSALQIVLYLVIFDFVTGLISAKYTGEQIKSAKIFRTVLKIILYFGTISSAYLLEKVININIGADNILIAFLAFTEFVSILENFAKCGLPVPQRLLNILDSIRK